MGNRPSEAELREAAERHDEAMRREAERNNPPVERLQGPLAQAEERALNERRPEDDESDAELAQLRARLSTLEESNDLTRKLVAQHGVGSVPDEYGRLMEYQSLERHRRIVYERIRANGDRVLIQIHHHEDPNRNFAIPIKAGDVQERTLPRGQPIYVSSAELEVLDHAEIDSVCKVIGQDGNPVEQRQRLNMYPYSIMDPAILIYANCPPSSLD